VPPTILGRDIEASRVLEESRVNGRRSRTMIERLNRHMRPFLDVEGDAEYQALFGAEGNDFDFDFAGCEVWKTWFPTFLHRSPLRVDPQIDVASPGSLNQALGTSGTDYFYVFLNGGAAYKGTANSTTLAVMSGSTVPTTQRDSGFMFIAADPGNAAGGITLGAALDRVKVTMPKVGGGSHEVWLALPKGDAVLAPGEFLFFDAYGNAFSGMEMRRDTFLACFTIQPSPPATFEGTPPAGEGADRFAEGAIANELELVRAHGRYVAGAMNPRNARGYELDHLAEKWFDVPRRSGEPDAALIDRIIAMTVGEKATPYAIAAALLTFSPWVIISEGMTGYGAYGRAFYHSEAGGPPHYEQWTGISPGPAYTEFVTLPFYSSVRGGLLFLRIRIESNPVTTDPITGAFIYDLIDRIILGGCGFELTLV